jgi:hypothetical protein
MNKDAKVPRQDVRANRVCRDSDIESLECFCGHDCYSGV